MTRPARAVSVPRSILRVEFTTVDPPDGSVGVLPDRVPDAMVQTPGDSLHRPPQLAHVCHGPGHQVALALLAVAEAGPP